MDQKKIGAFLKQLRNEKNLTQEELSEKFYVSTKTISRWETGSNLPDLSMLIELADFYEVDIRELIDGERHPNTQNNDNDDIDNKDTLKKVAQYSVEEKKSEMKYLLKQGANLVVALALWYIPSILFGSASNHGLLYENVSNGLRCFLFWLTYIPAIILIPYTSISLLHFIKKDYIHENESKKHKIKNAIYVIVLFLDLLIKGLFNEDYTGELFKNSSDDMVSIASLLLFVCMAYIFVVESIFVYRAMKSIDKDTTEKT